VHVKLEFARPFQSLCGDPLGAPGNVLEQTGIDGLQSEQIITAIGTRAKNGALSRLCQHVGGFDEQRGRQRRTVGIEDDRRGISARKNFLKRAQQAIAESGEARIDQADARRQGAMEKRLGFRGRESDVAGNRGVAPRQ